MSFPEYLNKIINSQLKNKQIETVRAEITKLISTNKAKKDNIALDHEEKQAKKSQMPKTVTNFFNVHSLHYKKEEKVDPRKTFSQMHINRLKKRLTLEEESRNAVEVPVPEDTTMSEWRLEMLKHLKQPIKKPLLEPKLESPNKDPEEQLTENLALPPKRKIKFNKSAKVTSTPFLRRLQRREKPKQEVDEGNLRVSSQRNIILIRPQPVSEEQLEEKDKEKDIPKLKKAALKLKRASRKSEAQEDELTIQRMANFTALLPYLGAQRAKVELREQKKVKPAEEAVGVMAQRVEKFYQRRKKQSTVEEVIEITGWEIHHD